MGASSGEYRCPVPIRDAEPTDLDAVFELLAARNRAAFGTTSLERKSVELDFALPGTDRLVAAEPEVVGFGSLDSAQRVEVAAPTAGDELLAALAERARARGFEQVNAIVAHADAPFDALVRRAAFEHRGDVLRMFAPLQRELPEPRWPDGVTVRTYADADARAVQALLDAAYAWDDTHVSRPHEEWLQWMTDHDEFDPELWLLAERDGELVGAALHWLPTRGRGWVKDLVVAESERGRGLGTALLHAGFRASRERGATQVGLKVDSVNPTGAVRLYERVGFVTDRRYGIWVKEP